MAQRPPVLVAGVRSQKHTVLVYHLPYFLRDSQFNCSRMPVMINHTPSFIVVVARYKSSCPSVYFLKFVLEQYTKPWSRTGHTGHLYTVSLTSCGHAADKSRLRKPRVLLTFLLTLLACIPSQVICNCYAKILDIFYVSKYCSL